mgnify:CR=1 FL=1
MNWLDGKCRCRWANPKNERYIRYHDEEWGVPVYSDHKLFEMLILEGFQAGLSWECVLNKRDAFRLAFDGFDIDRMAEYNADKISRLMQNSGIIRNRRKIEASIRNAKIIKEIVREFGSFYGYLKTFYDGETVYETDKTSNALSDTISRDLVGRGMSFVGSTIIYSFLQSVGIIYSHDENCFLYKKA